MLYVIIPQNSIFEGLFVLCNGLFKRIEND